MFVDTDLLFSGAIESHRAGGHVQEAAEGLSRAPLAAGMFGDLAAAEAFHATVVAAHAQHVRNLQSHHMTLTDIGSQAQQGAAEFTEMDVSNAATLRNPR